MPVYEAAYRRWDREGERRGVPALAIAAAMIRRVMRLRLVRLIVLVVPSLACFFSFIVFYAVYDDMLAMVVRQTGGEGFNLLHLVNQQFLLSAIWFGALIAALAGAPLIAEDRKAHALPLYFSKPITHLDYVAGKVLTVATFVALLLLVPPVLMYLVDVMLSKQENVAAAQLPSLLRSLAPGACAVLLFSTLSLAVSAVSRRPAYAALAFLGTFVLAGALAHVLVRGLHEFGWMAVSPVHCTFKISSEVLPLPDLPPVFGRFVTRLDVGLAWAGFGAWTALSVAVVAARVRRVEVVS